MLQSYDQISNPSLGAARVAALRDELKRRGLTGYVVPRADEHQGEDVPPAAARLLWLTGFSGSAGTAVVLLDTAAIFVDGRYTIQAGEQIDAGTFTIQMVPEARLSDWILAHAGPQARVGYDARLFTINQIDALEKPLTAKGIALLAIEDNLIDHIWADRPAPPVGAVVPHGLALAGKPAGEKLHDLQQELAKSGDAAVVVTAPDSIAWLLNIRGSDVPHTPFALSFVIAPATGKAQLFIDGRKIGANVRSHVGDVADILEPGALEGALARLGAAKAKVRFDPDNAARWFADRLRAVGAVLSPGADPCALAKAKKNTVEIEGARKAHLRDAVPMSRFLAWLDREAPKGHLDEISAAGRLEALRQETGCLKDLSFGTISAAGPHAALPHYRASRASNFRIAPDSIYLVDSGAQYEDGTTDITRTIAVGSPPEEGRRHFTLVLKGMIAISVARFPKGTRGSEIDAFARRALWDAGLDYDHGTGHGVGSYLGVHEGPQRIAKTGVTPLEAGMIISNEPGYYKPGAYGIRIENLVVVNPPAAVAGGDRPMMSFETLTLAPIDRRMIVAVLLTPAEIAWLDAYHARVAAEVGPLLAGADRDWLMAATRPL